MFSSSTQQKIALILSVVLAAFLLSTPALAERKKKKVKVFKNRYVVEMKESLQHHGADSVINSDDDRKLNRHGARVLKNLGAGKNKKFKLVSRKAGKEIEELADYDPNDTFCTEMIRSGEVEYCSPDFEITIADTVSNDPHYTSLWGMSNEQGIAAPQAWDLTTGSEEIVVAVIDTGVDYNHPDLAQNIWVNNGEIGGNGIDDDGNGYIDDVYGWNAVANNGNSMDDNGHGTHCAGTIGAVGNNARGVVGVNWNVKIMGLKFLNAYGSGSLSGAIQAINYMVAMKKRGVNIRVSNNSWGGGGFSQALYNAIQEANKAGIIFVAAAGNESNNNDGAASYPGGYDLPNVISVAAVDRDGNLASFSNYGATTVDIAAPGVGILSTYPGNQYASLSGTSMAAPHVSGALALLLAREPTLGALEAMDRATNTGKTLETLNGIVSSGRIVNVGNMVYNRVNPLPQPTPAPIPCSYTAQPIAFDPDLEAGSAPAVVHADEFNFYPLDLGFSFLYYGQYVSRVHISPNGLVYAKSAPTSMDYVNKSQAPINSMAALHSDLTTSEAPYAVRAKLGSNHATIYWHAQTYAAKELGDIKAWLTIYADGTIDASVNIDSSELLTHMRSKSTIGLSGPKTSDRVTYSYNDSNLKSQTAVRFLQQCNVSGGDGSITVEKIRFSGKSSARSSRSVNPGRAVTVDIIGSGTGTVSLQASFNGRACPNAIPLSFDNGTSLTGKMPRVSKEFSTLRLRAGEAKKSIKLLHSKRSNSRQKARRINSKKLNKYCDSFLNSLTYR